MTYPRPEEMSTFTVGGDDVEHVALKADMYRDMRSKAITADKVAGLFDMDVYDWTDLSDAINKLYLNQEDTALQELMERWERHILLEWPEGVKLVIDDPEAFQGDPRPRIVLSEDLQEVLDD